MTNIDTSTPAGAVVVGYDGSDNAHPALVFAADEATRRQVPLHVIFAFLAPRSWGSPMPSLDIDRIGDAVLARAREVVTKDHPGVEITSEFFQGDPVPVLVNASRAAGVVVVGARGLGGVRRALLGSVSQKVTSGSVSPVIVVHGPPGNPDGPVLVGMDPDEQSGQVMTFGFEEARRRGVPLLVVQAHQHASASMRFSEEGGFGEYLRAAADAAEGEGRRLVDVWQDKYPDVPVTIEQVRGQAADALIAAAQRACILVVGDHGRSGLAAKVIGSVTQAVLHEAPIVTVVKIKYDQ